MVLNLQSSTLLGPVGNGVLLLRCDSLVLITGQFSEATLECGLPVVSLCWASSGGSLHQFTLGRLQSRPEDNVLRRRRRQTKTLDLAWTH